MTNSNLPTLLVAACAAASLATALPAVADTVGSAASSASSAGSASIASLSDSVQGSSRSSAGERQVAQGDYRVASVTALADGTARLDVRLEQLAEPAGEAVSLRVPREALRQRAIAPGDIVHVRHRPYGLEFARTADTGTREPFLLALTDTWQRELSSRALGL